MKRVTGIFLALLMCAGILSAAACARGEPVYTVMLEENAAFRIAGDAVQYVQRGGDAEFFIEFSQEYRYLSNDGGAEYDAGRLFVRNVRSDKRIAVTAEKLVPENGRAEVTQTQEGYVYTATPAEGYVFTGWYENGELLSYANGLLLAQERELTADYARRGEKQIVTVYANGGNVYGSAADSISYSYHSDVYLYPAALGEWAFRTFYREGYTALCLNTAADGSGREISFGSRVLSDSDISLYVIWQMQSDASLFTWEKAVYGGEDVIRLTGYSGSESTVAVPHEIAGLPVRIVGSGCFSGVALQRAVLHEGIRAVEEGAFASLPAFSELYFCDSIVEIGDGSFSDCPALAHLRVSACMAPRYTNDLVASLVRRVEKLYSVRNSDRTSLLFYGGSGVYQSLDGQTLYDEFGGKFNIINCAQNANISAPFLFDVFADLAGEGDVMVYMPEFYDDSYSTELNMVTWIATESFYDAWRCVDVRNYDGVFDAFEDYQTGNAGFAFAGRVEKQPLGYYEECAGLNEYFTRDYIAESLPDAYFRVRSINFSQYRSVVPLLNEIYAQYAQRGAYAYQSFAAYYEKAYSNSIYEIEDFCNYLRENLDFPVVSDCKNHIFPLEMIYDEVTHLTTEGAIVNSKILAMQLKPQLKADGLY